MIHIQPRAEEARARLMNRTGFGAYRVRAYRVVTIGGRALALFGLLDVVDDATRAHLLAELAHIHGRSVASQYAYMTEQNAYFSLPMADYEVMEVVEG